MQVINRRRTIVAWLVVAACLLAAGAGILWGIGTAWHATELADAPLTSTTRAVVLWEPGNEPAGRVLEPAVRDQIAADYTRAWVEWNLAYRNRTTAGLGTYFSGDARTAIVASVRQAIERDELIYQVDTSHRLQAHVYSADGTIVSFTDAEAVVTQFVLDDAGNLLLDASAIASYDVVMKLEDGNWRIANWVRTGAERFGEVAPAAGGASIVSTDGAGLLLDGAPFTVHGANYYPRDTPWERFWTDYDPVVIDADFTLMRDQLRLNTIRIFVPYEQFGGPQVSGEMLGKLDDLLWRARDHQLQVVVTLFDFFGAQYDPLRWPDIDRHLTGIVSRFRDHPAILAWDLKNEPDLDPTEDAVVDAWLRHVGWYVRSLDSSHLITVGWAHSTSVGRAVDVVDLATFHWYERADAYGTALEEVRDAAPGTPILLGEFGLPTWNSPFFPGGHTEREQAAYYADILRTSRDAGIAGTLAWTLHDFPEVPETVGGRWPWQSGPEQHLGVMRMDGTAKPAAALLAPGASLDVPEPGRFDRLQKRFWRTVILVVLVTGIGTAAVWWRRRPAGASR